MCAISIELDNSLMERFRNLFDSQERLTAWMSTQMEFLINQYLENPSRIEHRGGLSDEELDRLFCGRTEFDESTIPDLSKSDFQEMIRHHAHKTCKSIEKWL